MASGSRIPFVALPLVVSATVVALAQGPPAPPAQPAASPSTPESVKKAEQVLAETRKALGGLDRVKTMVASGRTKRVRGNNLVPIEFEILFELPSKYVRIDEFPAEDADPTSAGFNGDALIQNPPPPAGAWRARSSRRTSACSHGTAW